MSKRAKPKKRSHESVRAEGNNASAEVFKSYPHRIWSVRDFLFLLFFLVGSFFLLSHVWSVFSNDRVDLSRLSGSEKGGVVHTRFQPTQDTFEDVTENDLPSDDATPNMPDAVISDVNLKKI